MEEAKQVLSTALNQETYVHDITNYTGPLQPEIYQNLGQSITAYIFPSYDSLVSSKDAVNDWNQAVKILNLENTDTRNLTIFAYFLLGYFILMIVFGLLLWCLKRLGCCLNGPATIKLDDPEKFKRAKTWQTALVIFLIFTLGFLSFSSLFFYMNGVEIYTLLDKNLKPDMQKISSTFENYSKFYL